MPRTLAGQTLATMLVGLAFAMAAGAWIYWSAGDEAVRSVGALGAAQRIVNVTRLVDEVPVDWRPRIVAGANDTAFRVRLVGQAPLSESNAGDGKASEAIGNLLRQALPGREIRVAVQTVRSEGRQLVPPMGDGLGPGRLGAGGRWGIDQHPMMHGPGTGGGDMPVSPMPPMLGMYAALSWRSLDVAVRLSSGQWLTYSTSLPDTTPPLSWRLAASLAVMVALIGAITAWAVRRVVAPLGVLAKAAERLGRDVETEPLPVVTGSVELQQATRAFNGMHERLRRLVENRTLMLAAISHDLRTQLTLLRLRAETGEGADDRERMLRTIRDMEDMLGATLEFAHDDVSRELARRTDVSALAMSIVDDMADAGLPVRAGQIEPGVVLLCKPGALRRAVTNLVDNAVKYGECARVGVARVNAGVEIVVEDDGPGIPEPHLAAVLQPFHRLEGSRSRETGGMGLGLAIASGVALAHGGELILGNRQEGGLRAALRLPE